jgi:cytochrome P450
MEVMRLNATRDEVERARQGGAGYMALLTVALRREIAAGEYVVLKELVEEFAAMDDAYRPPDDAAVFFAAFALDAFHTLGTQVANAAYALISAPEAYEIVRQDSTQVPTAFLEGSRIKPGVIVTPRQAVADFEYQGVAVPRGTRFLMLWSIGNRDPMFFENPSGFRLERENRTRQFTFGTGFYICPGRNLGKLLGEIVLAGLARPGVEAVPAGQAVWKQGSMHHDPLRMPVSLRYSG